jgi:hypothetical protein
VRSDVCDPWNVICKNRPTVVAGVVVSNSMTSIRSFMKIRQLIHNLLKKKHTHGHGDMSLSFIGKK